MACVVKRSPGAGTLRYVMGHSHKINVGSVLAGSGRRLVVADRIALEPFEGIAFPEPLRVDLEVGFADGQLLIEGKIAANFRGECDLCLGEVCAEMLLDVDERIELEDEGIDGPFGESNVLVGESLDVGDLAMQLVLSALPLGLRCSRECQGLCPQCGTNLNASTCSCQNGEKRGKSEVENSAQ